MVKRLISIRIDEKLLKEIEKWSSYWKTRTETIEKLIEEGLKLKKRKAMAMLTMIYLISGFVALLIWFGML